MNIPTRLRIALCVACLGGAATLAAPKLAVTPADQEMTRQAYNRLVAVAQRPENFPNWPPVLNFLDEDVFNAHATFKVEDGKKVAYIETFGGLYPKGIEGKIDRIAMVLGHEIAHHVLGHTRRDHDGTAMVETTFTRTQEYAADLLGMELFLKAGFSFKGGVGLFQHWIDIGVDYTSFEGASVDHPAPIDRITQLDKQQQTLWRAMGAFGSGAYFLETQQYSLAERAFRQVTKEFPDAYEAWANLGYAILMQYADALETDDLRKFNLGQIVVGGFYRRPASLAAKVRGPNEDMWWEAVGALREAIRLNSSLALPKANLGIAYLVKPGGKDPGKAVQFLEEARQLAQKDDTLDASARLCLAVNLAVAYSADGKSSEFQALLDSAEAAVKEAAATRNGAGPAAGALAYNRALARAASSDAGSRQQALADFENYLRTTSPSVAWWSLAYERYATLSGELGVKPKSRDALLARADSKLRQVASVSFGKTIVAINDSLDAVTKALGPGTVVPVVAGTNLVRISYPDRGLDLLATDVVIAIQLVSDKAPGVPLRAQGVSSKSSEVKVGMTTDQLDAVLGELAANYDFRQLVDKDVNYRFYSEIGLAVRVKKGAVIEVALAMIPKESLIQ